MRVKQEYLLEGPRFAWEDNAASGRSGLPASRSASKAIGYFVWQPERPGWRLLSRMAPALLGALLIVALIVALFVYACAGPRPSCWRARRRPSTSHSMMR